MRSPASRRIVSLDSLRPCGKPIAGCAGIDPPMTCQVQMHAMTLFSVPMATRDAIFAAQPMISALLDFPRMHTFIKPVAHSCPSNKPEDAE